MTTMPLTEPERIALLEAAAREQYQRAELAESRLAEVSKEREELRAERDMLALQLYLICDADNDTIIRAGYIEAARDLNAVHDAGERLFRALNPESRK